MNNGQPATVEGRELRVSVWMITYNQASYIAEAIEGVLMQQTGFPVELVIGEDGSKDDTRKIILDYCARHPGRIRLLPNTRNLGMMGNMIRTLEACRGKYVALCEGDDYWTDPYKLQKQFDFMEANPDCSLCFHAAHNIYPDQDKNFIKRSRNRDTWVSLKDAVGNDGTFFPTASLFFKGELIESLPSWFSKAVVGDYPLGVLLAMNGKVWYMDQVMSVYRREAVGSWSTGWSVRRMRHFIWGNSRTLLSINRATKYRYSGVIARHLLRANWGLFKAYVYQAVRSLYVPFKRTSDKLLVKKAPYVR